MGIWRKLKIDLWGFVFSLDYHRENSRRIGNCFPDARYNEPILRDKSNNCRKGTVAFHKEERSRPLSYINHVAFA